MKCKIIDIGEDDAFFEDKNSLVGATGKCKVLYGDGSGFVAAVVTTNKIISIIGEDPRREFLFVAVKLEEIK
jgi:hypothetical protein